MGEDGELYLVRTDANGHDQYGPQIAYNSPDWANLQHAFDQSGSGNPADHGGSTAVITVTGKQYDNGGDWAQWNGEIDTGGGGNSRQALEAQSGDDPDYGIVGVHSFMWN